MKIKLTRMYPILISFLLLGLLSAGCSNTPKQKEIPVGDITIVWPSMYNGSTRDVDADDIIHRKLMRICRDLDAFIELCPGAGIGYGVDTPAYSNEWFEDNAIIILAFTTGSKPHELSRKGPSISVGKVFENGGMAQVELHQSQPIIFDAVPYSIIIELEARHLEGVENVEILGPEFIPSGDGQ